MNGFGRIVGAGMRKGGLRSVALAVVVVALAAAGLSSAVVVRADAEDRVDGAFAAVGGPDLVMTVTSAGEPEVRRALVADAQVVEVAPPRSVLDAQAEIGDRRIDIAVNGLDTASSSGLNRPVVTSGRLPADPMEITMDAGIADEIGLALGDSLVVRAGSVTRSPKIVGFAYDFTDCFYPNCDPGRAWVEQHALAAFGVEPATLLAVDVRDTESAESVARRVSDLTGDGVLGFNTWPDTRGDLLTESQFFGAFLGAFGLLALIASAVVIAGMMAARTLARQQTLAKFRALGFTRGQVTGALLVEHGLIGVAGLVLGNVGAALVAPRLRIGALAVLDGGSAGLPLGAVIVSSTIVAIAIAASTLPPALRAGRRDTITSLRAAPTASVPSRAVDRLLDRARLPLSVSLGVRAAFVRPLRSLLCVLAITLAVVTAMVATSVDRTMDRMLAHPELTGDPSDAEVEPAAGTAPAQAESMLGDMPELSGWSSLADDTATISGRSVHVRAVGGDPRAAGVAIGGGSPLVEPGQAIAGYGLMNAMGWRIGDRIHLDVHGRGTDVNVVGWYRETEDSGEVLRVRMEDFHRVSVDVNERYTVRGATGTTRRDVAAALRRAFGEDANIRVNEVDGGHLQPFRIALATMAALIGAVALANMFAAAVITSRERSRRVGALRAVGLTRWSLVAEAIAGSTVLVGAAAAVAVPVGWFAQRWIGDLLTAELGAGPGLTVGASAQQLVAMIAIVACVGAAAAAIAGRPTIRRRIPDLLGEAP